MKQTRRIEALDGLRGILAVFIAFIWHYQHFDSTINVPFKDDAEFWVYISVEVFFVISGFCLAMHYEDMILAQNISFIQYMKKRIIHIWPLMIMTLLVVTYAQNAIVGITGETFVYPNFSITYFIMNVFMIQTAWLVRAYSFNGPAWCISIEMFCYLVFYIVLFCISKSRNKKSVLSVYIVLAVAGAIVACTRIGFPIINEKMARGVSGFFLGGGGI